MPDKGEAALVYDQSELLIDGVNRSEWNSE
jgi:hypothetical protein